MEKLGTKSISYGEPKRLEIGDYKVNEEFDEIVHTNMHTLNTRMY